MLRIEIFVEVFQPIRHALNQHDVGFIPRAGHIGVVHFNHVNALTIYPLFALRGNGKHIHCVASSFYLDYGAMLGGPFCSVCYALRGVCGQLPGWVIKLASAGEVF